jgi:cardiolipin synthase
MSHASSVPRGGHDLQLLQGSGELFPTLVEAIDSAQREVLLETYIFDFTGHSAEIAYALERAARRAVSVKVVVDGFGSAPLPPARRRGTSRSGFPSSQRRARRR